MSERPNLDQGHGVRFEKVIVAQIKRLALASGLTYSEMTRVLVDEAILARLTRTELDRDVLREAVFHAIEHQPKEDVRPLVETYGLDPQSGVRELQRVIGVALGEEAEGW